MKLTIDIKYSEEILMPYNYCKKYCLASFIQVRSK